MTEGDDAPVLLVETRDRIRVLTLNRPYVRNALSQELRTRFFAALAEVDDDDTVDVVIVTGADPAFCAGLDLADLAQSGVRGEQRTLASSIGRELIPRTMKPIVGAVNGPAVTGGLELALSCDFLIASVRATFADTHARVGVMPGAGMTIRLPQAVGISRARQMSLTGNFIDASTALAWGLVSEVVPHEMVVARATELARAIGESDPTTIAELRSMYETFAGRSDADALAEEARWSARWMTERFDADALFESKDRIIRRGSSQQ